MRFLLWGTMLVGALWFGLAAFAVPPLIRNAHHGRGPRIFISLMGGRHQHPVEYYLDKWQQLNLAALGAGVAIVLGVLVTKRKAFFHHLVGQATPGTLGAIRVLASTVLLLNTLWEDIDSSALLPAEMRQPMGLLQCLYALPIGFEQLVGSQTGLSVLKWLTAALLLLGAVGLWTRAVVPLAAVCYLVFGGILRQYSHLFHTCLTPLYLLAVLAWTPCGDGWSLDRLRKIWKGRPVPPVEQPAAAYGWGRYACWVAVALPYLAAGLSKLRNCGLAWCSGPNLRAIIYTDNLSPMHFDWGLGLRLTAAPDSLFALIGYGALVAELLFVLVLFSRIARGVLPVMMLLLHLGIFLLQNVLFFDLFFVLLIFFDWRVSRKKIRRRLARRCGLIQLLYDGLCPLCRRTVRLLAGWDLLDRLEFIDFRRLDLAAYNETHCLDLRAHDLEEEMHVVSARQVYRGFFGYRLMALWLPAFWAVAPLLFLPGISTLGLAVYRMVASHRLKLLKCDSTCPFEPVGGGAPELARPAENAAGILRGPALVCIVATILMWSWLYGVEFYPLSTMQMYTGPVTSGVITYYKVLGRDQGGRVARAYPEEMIGAVSDTRYRLVLASWFPTGAGSACDKFLAACAAAHNKNTPPGAKLTQLELQKWTWDFRARPLDPSHGELVGRHVLDIGNNVVDPDKDAGSPARAAGSKE